MKFKTPRAFFSSPLAAIRNKPSQLAKQQTITFFLYSFALVTGLLINLCGFSGPQKMLTLVLNSVFMGITLLLILAYKTGRISLPHAFCAMTVVAQLFTCNEMILCALSPSEYRLMLIVGNMTLLAVNVMFSLIAYLRRIPYVLGGMGMVTYIVCMFITGNTTLKNFCILYMVLFLIVTVLGNLLVKNIQRLGEENSTLKREEEEILRVLKMEKEQVRAYVRLAKQRHGTVETNNLLEMLGAEAQNNVIHNVKEAITAKEMEQYHLSEVFPELTPSEIEICRLVILGKTLKEVCEILGKSESNITCQRSNIRKKIGLKPSDNLRQVLTTQFEKNGKNPS
ncbi:LuxR C-terminal-related transcriptional regulator [Phocaeicola dorei]|uniref:LuxR C-terminal-related transcriptional regulator n=1 Tax=Phocaeicola dorei TaxID=357276 RepID=UPI0018763BA0|nr:LuxR C-terminal-related transcriptional regulator [Phocaeicola dorei]MBE5080259.1 hypothetical protein [Phocaeicola dorei]